MQASLQTIYTEECKAAHSNVNKNKAKAVIFKFNEDGTALEVDNADAMAAIDKKTGTTA